MSWSARCTVSSLSSAGLFTNFFWFFWRQVFWDTVCNTELWYSEINFRSRNLSWHQIHYWSSALLQWIHFLRSQRCSVARQARRMVIGLFQSEMNEINITSKKNTNFKGIDFLIHKQHVFIKITKEINVLVNYCKPGIICLRICQTQAISV